MKISINCPECGKKTDIVFYAKLELTINSNDLIWTSIFKCDHCRKDFAVKFNYTPHIETAKISFQKCNQE